MGRGLDRNVSYLTWKSLPTSILAALFGDDWAVGDPWICGHLYLVKTCGGLY